MTFDAKADMKRIGGPIELESAQEVGLEVYVDHSAVEVFVSTGEALATRCSSTACIRKNVVRLCCAQHYSFRLLALIVPNDTSVVPLHNNNAIFVLCNKSCSRCSITC